MKTRTIVIGAVVSSISILLWAIYRTYWWSVFPMILAHFATLTFGTDVRNRPAMFASFATCAAATIAWWLGKGLYFDFSAGVLAALMALRVLGTLVVLARDMKSESEE